MKHFFLSLSIMLLLYNCSNSQKINIAPLTMLTEIDTLKQNNSHRFDYFMVDCITNDTAKVKMEIDIYVNRQSDSNRTRYKYYEMLFYKKSENVNPENILSYPENLRYKTVLYDEPMRTYTWFDGKLLYVK